MVSYVAQGLNISPLQAEIYLTKLIKSRSYYKNYIKYSKIKEVLNKLCVLKYFILTFLLNLTPIYYKVGPR